MVGMDWVAISLAVPGVEQPPRICCARAATDAGVVDFPRLRRCLAGYKQLAELPRGMGVRRRPPCRGTGA